MFIWPDVLLQLFNLKKYMLHWQDDIKFSFIFIWIYFLFAGLYWVYASILIANHRTKFIMIGNILGIWLLTALPIYLLAHYGKLATHFIWPIMCAYAFFGCVSISIYYILRVSGSRASEAHT